MLRQINSSLLICIAVVSCTKGSNTAIFTENVKINGQYWPEDNFFEGQSSRIAFHIVDLEDRPNSDTNMMIEIAAMPDSGKTIVAFKAHLYLVQCHEAGLIATFEYSSHQLGRSVLPQGFEFYRPICLKLETVVIGSNGHEEVGDRYAIQSF